MRYTPGLPPLVEPPADAGEVKATAAVRASHVVGPRTLPPIIYRHYQAPTAPPPAATEHAVPHITRQALDRRQQYRRTQNQAVLQDLRSHQDRRHHNRRADDVTTHIDEKT